MARHVLTHEDRVKGGKARAAQPSFRDACSKGFWATMDSHPYFARNHLKKLVRTGDENHKPRKAA